MAKSFPRQAFVLSTQITEAIRVNTKADEIEATWQDMEELGIAKPPYPQFDVIMQAGQILRPANREWYEAEIAKMPDLAMENWKVLLRYENGKSELWVEYQNRRGHFYPVSEIMRPGGAPRPLTPADVIWYEQSVPALLAWWYKATIVLLASRGTIRETKRDKLAAAGIGRDHKHVYTTSIDLAQAPQVASAELGTSRAPMRPHLRRGHIRHQAHGPGMQYRKPVWIEPTFVNGAEPDLREGYNVRRPVHA
jgi:hypothetical protein